MLSCDAFPRIFRVKKINKWIVLVPNQGKRERKLELPSCKFLFQYCIWTVSDVASPTYLERVMNKYKHHYTSNLAHSTINRLIGSTYNLQFQFLQWIKGIEPQNNLQRPKYKYFNTVCRFAYWFPRSNFCRLSISLHWSFFAPFCQGRQD